MSLPGLDPEVAIQFFLDSIRIAQFIAVLVLGLGAYDIARTIRVMRAAKRARMNAERGA